MQQAIQYSAPRSDSDPYAVMQTVNTDSGVSQSYNEEEQEQYKEVFVWGSDMRGQLGINSRAGKSYSVPKLVCFHTVIKQVSCGQDHAALITYQGYLYTMGSNQDGKLGIGSSRVLSANVPTLVQSLDAVQLVQVSCGWTHTAAISVDGNAYAWGLSQQGALGLGKIQQRAVHQPILITFFQRHQMSVQQVSCGSMHTGFVTGGNELYVCGNGNQGQLGLGKCSRQFHPKHVTRTLEPVVKVACGIFHTCYITDKGQVYGMGGNNFGQLGNGGKKNSLAPVLTKGFSGKRIVDISCGHHSGAITDQGQLYIWGTGVFGQYLTPQKFTPANQDHGHFRFTQVSIGGTFGGVTSENGTVWSWGMNQSGELGVGDSNPRMCPVLVQSISHKRVSQISCGGSFAVATGQVVLSSSSQKPNPQQTSSYSYPVGSSKGLNMSNFPPPPHSIGFQSKAGGNSQLNISSDQNNSTPAIGNKKLSTRKNSARSLRRKQSNSKKPRNFGEDLKNKNSSEKKPFQNANQPGLMHIDDPLEDGTTQSYINLLKQQKQKLQDQLHHQKVERIKSQNQVRQLHERLQLGQRPSWEQQLRQRVRQLQKDNNSSKYALIEERNRNSNLEEENKKLLNAMNDQLSLIQSRNDSKGKEMFSNSQNLLNSQLKRQNEALRNQIQRLQDDLLSHSRSNNDLKRKVDHLNRRLDELDGSNRQLEQKRRQIQDRQERDINSKARREKERTLDAIQSGNSHDILQEKKNSYNQVPPSPTAPSNSIYGKGPSYKQRRFQNPSEKWDYPDLSKKSERRCSPRTPKQVKFSDVSPDVRREKELQQSQGPEQMSLRRSQRSPFKNSIVARSPQREPSLPSSPAQKPKLSPIIKDDLVGSKPPWKKSIINPKYDEPRREPCGFTKAPTINVISPQNHKLNLVDQTPKFHSRAASQNQGKEDGNERGRQMNSYKEKLLRDLQRSVGSPFSGGAAPSFKKPYIRESDYRYNIRNQNTRPVDDDRELLERSSEKLLQLTKSPHIRQQDKREEEEEQAGEDFQPHYPENMAEQLDFE